MHENASSLHAGAEREAGQSGREKIGREGKQSSMRWGNNCEKTKDATISNYFSSRISITVSRIL